MSKRWQLEMDALGWMIQHLARALADLRLRRRTLRNEAPSWSRRMKTERGRELNKAACKRYRAKKKAQRLVDPYMGRRYDKAA